MDQNQGTATGNATVGDAAPQNGTNNTETPQNPPAGTPAAAMPTETDAERGLRTAAEVERRKRQETEAQLFQAQAIINQMAAQLRPPTEVKPAADPIGLSDQDLLDPAKVRQGLLQVRQEALDAVRQTQAELQFRMQFPDFDAVVGTPDPATAHLPPQHQRFLYSDLVQELVREDPQFVLHAQQSGNPRVYAYSLAKKQQQIRELRKATATQETQTAQQQAAARSAQNTAAALTSPMSPSAVSGAPSQTTEVDALQMARTNPKVFDELIQSIAAGKYG